MIAKYSSTRIIMVPDPSIPRLEEVAFCPWGPQSFFKALFVGTKRGDTLKGMTLTKAVSQGLKPHKWERGSHRNKPPIPYIPEKDKLQEAIESGATTIKLLLRHKVEVRVSV